MADAWEHAARIVDRLTGLPCARECIRPHGAADPIQHHKDCPRVLTALNGILRAAPATPLRRAP